MVTGAVERSVEIGAIRVLITVMLVCCAFIDICKEARKSANLNLNVKYKLYQEQKPK